MSRKAQFGSLQAIIITLVVIGILLGIGFLILEEFQGTMDEESATVVNETIGIPTDAGVYASKNSTTAGINCYNTFVVTQALNKSTVIASGNYTYNTNTGKVTNLTNEYITYPWNVTYTYKYGLEGCGGVVSTISAVSKIPTWLTVIVLLLIVGVVLAIVFNVLPTGGAGTGSGFGSIFRRSGGTVAEI